MKNIKSYTQHINEQAGIISKVGKKLYPLVSELIDKMHGLLPKAYRSGEAFDVFMNGLKELDPADRKELVQSVLKHSADDGAKVSGKMVLKLPAKGGKDIEVPITDGQYQTLKEYLK